MIGFKIQSWPEYIHNENYGKPPLNNVSSIFWNQSAGWSVRSLDMRSTLVEIDNYICVYISAAVLTYHLNDLSAGSSEPKWGGRDLHSGPWKERSAFFYWICQELFTSLCAIRNQKGFSLKHPVHVTVPQDRDKNWKLLTTQVMQIMQQRNSTITKWQSLPTGWDLPVIN